MRKFELVDVFGEDAFTGNPLGVVHAADGLSSEEMLRITQWLNLSETVFLLPPTEPEADYRSRIFTLDRELPFAGHPTLGGCHAWLRAGGRPKATDHVVQQCGAGLVRVAITDEGLAFAAPPLLKDGPVDASTRTQVARLLNIDETAIVAATWADNGPGWIAVMLDSANAVLAVEPARYHPERIEIGLVGRHHDAAEPLFEVRAFFSDHNRTIIEDPVTGSLNASIGQWLFARGDAAVAYRAIQGTCVGRRGRIDVRQRDGQTWVGGVTRTLVSGELA